MENLTFTTLKQLARGLAEQFGSNCEIVIHDLSEEHIDNSIVHIENGHVTGNAFEGAAWPFLFDGLAKKSGRFERPIRLPD